MNLQIGKPLRTIVVESLELPVKESKVAPEPIPVVQPEAELETVPVTQ